MIVCLDTSTPTCRLTLLDENTYVYEWEASRELAKSLLGFLDEKLAEHRAAWQNITGLAIFRGPGSFTGLRIGITVMNTLADGLGIPIVGTIGDDWQAEALSRLQAGENDQLVLPEYGGEAHITTPKK